MKSLSKGQTGSAAAAGGDSGFIGIGPGAVPPLSPEPLKRPSSATSHRSRISNLSTNCSAPSCAPSCAQSRSSCCSLSRTSSTTTGTCHDMGFRMSSGPTSAEREVKAFLSNVLECGSEGPVEAWASTDRSSEDEVYIGRAASESTTSFRASRRSNVAEGAVPQVPPDRPAISAEKFILEALEADLEIADRPAISAEKFILEFLEKDLEENGSEDEVRIERPVPSRQPTVEVSEAGLARAAEDPAAAVCYYLHDLSERGAVSGDARGSSEGRRQDLGWSSSRPAPEALADEAADLKIAPGWIDDDCITKSAGYGSPAAARRWPVAADAAVGGAFRPVISAEALVETYFRSRLEGTSTSSAMAMASLRSFKARQRQHFDSSSESEDDDCAPSASSSGAPRTEMLPSKEGERLLGQRRPSKLSLIPIAALFRRNSRPKASSMLQESLASHDELWFGTHLLRLQSDGMACSKVAHHGNLVQRSVHIVASAGRLFVELRGGKAAPKALGVEDITDIQRGLGSQEFRFFLQRLKKDTPVNLADRSVVLMSSRQSLSLIFPSEDLRDTLAHCILYLREAGSPSSLGG